MLDTSLYVYSILNYIPINPGLDSILDISEVVVDMEIVVVPGHEGDESEDTEGNKQDERVLERVLKGLLNVIYDAPYQVDRNYR